MNQTSPTRIAITGAGSGLGRAIALRYARDGARVAVTDIDPERADAVAAEVETAGGESLARALDTRNEADYAALVEALTEAWGGVDVWVNNAGVAAAGTVADTPEDDWRWLIDINLMGVVTGCRHALPLVRASQGHVVNVASFAAIASSPGMAAYNVVKAGVLSLSETLRGEEHDRGVGVSVVCPAFFQTNLMDNFRAHHPRQQQVLRKLMERSPITADDVAEAVHGAVAGGRFMVIPNATERRQYWFKRLTPEGFFRAVLKATRGFTQ